MYLVLLSRVKHRDYRASAIILELMGVVSIVKLYFKVKHYGNVHKCWINSHFFGAAGRAALIRDARLWAVTSCTNFYLNFTNERRVYSVFKYCALHYCSPQLKSVSIGQIFLSSPDLSGSELYFLLRTLNSRYLQVMKADYGLCSQE